MGDNNNDIKTIKQLLNNSIKESHFDYIKQIIDKNVKDCNLLYTQVCYLIKLFLLHDFEINNQKYNDYKFDELFIRNCFKLIKTGQINLNNNDITNNEYTLMNRIFNFYNSYNSNQSNQFKFIKPKDVSSITHITDALSRDIQTNIINNIIINYFKYIKEYININIKLEFKDIESNQIIKIYNDIINNTLYSDSKYHLWINKHYKLIIPEFKNKISINSFKDGIDNHNSLFLKFINQYVKNNQNLLNLININDNDKKNKSKILKEIINKLLDETYNFNKYNDWINDNKTMIINEFNLSCKIDLDKELIKNPYIFIPYMLFMNKNLELNNSKKKYQIIPLRTNLTPKFIPISIDSLVDILDSKYLLGKIKNYYHNDNKKGLILFETYFKFDSKYIKNTLKKGYIFSGLIYTNGYEINYIFNSKSYEINKNNFHCKGKEEIKLIKENTINLNDKEKEEFILKRKEKKENEKKENDIKNKEKNKKIKQDEKDKLNKILKSLENEILELNNKFELDLKEIELAHYNNFKLEFDKIDKSNVENKKLMNEINERLNNKFISDNVYLKHEYDRNYSSLITDYNNNIDIKYNQIINKKNNNDELIKNIKQKIKKLKIELKKSKPKKSKNQIIINKNIKIKLKRLILKIKEKTELLNYVTVENLSLTLNHKINIIKNISNILLQIKNMKLSVCLNEYLDSLENINNYLLSSPINIIKLTVNTCLRYISICISNKKNNDLLHLKNKKIESLKNQSYNNKNYFITLNELNNYSKELTKLGKEKQKIDNELIRLFKDKNNEFIKVDNMSKKMLSILNKMNYAVIDPGTNTLLTILSKDGKRQLNYSKSHYLNKTKRKETLKKIERIKKEKITKLENKLTKETIRLKTSNDYKKFNDYFTIKMELNEELLNLYNDKRLNKLNWYSFINNKRSESDLVNKIKNKFGNDVVLILGDWSMNKTGLKTISTPNKKYEKILGKYFLTLKINEFRTSIIDNKTELKCENLILNKEKIKMSVKQIYSLEKLKNINIKKYVKATSNKKIHKILTCKTSEKFIKYINRDNNSVKNMLKIISSYILNNKKPIIFVMGTKICNDIKKII